MQRVCYQTTFLQAKIAAWVWWYEWWYEWWYDDC